MKFAPRDGLRPKIQVFRNDTQEMEWVAGEIHRLVKEQHVRPQDILVLFETPYAIRDLEAKWRDLQDNRIIHGFHHVYSDAPTGGSYLFRDGHVTLATTRSAKGYDAPVVFLVATNTWDGSAKSRASFYVGATRAKHMLYLTGTDRHNSLLFEAENVQRVLARLDP